jgi:hypothetical protein
MSLEKERAGAFNKAQRLIEYLRTMQERRVGNPTLGSPFQKESRCLYSIRDQRHMITSVTGGMMMTEPKFEVPAELRQLAEAQSTTLRRRLAFYLTRHVGRLQPVWNRQRSPSKYSPSPKKA